MFSYIFMALLWSRCINISMLISYQKSLVAHFLLLTSWPKYAVFVLVYVCLVDMTLETGFWQQLVFEVLRVFQMFV